MSLMFKISEILRTYDLLKKRCRSPSTTVFFGKVLSGEATFEFMLVAGNLEKPK